jgi:hypothetical protein
MSAIGSRRGKICKDKTQVLELRNRMQKGGVDTQEVAGRDGDGLAAALVRTPQAASFFAPVKNVRRSCPIR